jgi:uncharacterized protein (TIGR00730 family)
MQSVCVFCGSSQGANSDYLAAATELGSRLANLRLTLVYGGANIGLMGRLADAALAQGGEVIGVMPRGLVQREIAHGGLSELLIVDSMHARKRKMADLADAFIALPGGLGTLEEILEALTWTQLRIHEKPCGLLNVRGFFDHLIAFFGHCVQEGFVGMEHGSMLLAEADPAVLLRKLAAAKTPKVDKLTRR